MFFKTRMQLRRVIDKGNAIAGIFLHRGSPAGLVRLLVFTALSPEESSDDESYLSLCSIPLFLVDCTEISKDGAD